MAATGTNGQRSHGGSAEKREAITNGALRVFARDGYTRASIDAIAAEAAVSTRTIYNHFRNKEDVFRAVIEESASRVAEAQLALLETHLDAVTDLEADLVRLATAWSRPMFDYRDHFSIVRQIRAEVGHIPDSVLDAWRDAGPRRVTKALARHLQHLADRGLLDLADPHRAALQFTTLVAEEVVTRTFHGLLPLPDEEIADIAVSGVHVFLHGYLPAHRSPRPRPKPSGARAQT